jgi:hypothetical protein
LKVAFALVVKFLSGLTTPPQTVWSMGGGQAASNRFRANGKGGTVNAEQPREGVCAMKKSGQMMTCGDFKVLRYAVARTDIPGEWTKGGNHRQFRAASGAVLNYWKSNGTITFQGPELAAAKLKAMFLNRAVVVKQP